MTTPENEQWRAIPGFDGYEVSDLGRVVSHRKGRTRVLRGSVNRDGYRDVGLYRDGQLSIHRVHRVVGWVFLGPMPSGMQTRHLDGDKLNNRLDNLAYGSASQNTRDQLAHGTHFFASKTHCPALHPYDRINTYVTRNGKRMCRVCKRERQAAARALAAANIQTLEDAA